MLPRKAEGIPLECSELQKKLLFLMSDVEGDENKQQEESNIDSSTEQQVDETLYNENNSINNFRTEEDSLYPPIAPKFIQPEFNIISTKNIAPVAEPEAIIQTPDAEIDLSSPLPATTPQDALIESQHFSNNLHSDQHEVIQLPKPPIWKILVMGFFQIGPMVGLFYSTGIYLPNQVQQYAGEEDKSNVLSIVGLICAITQMIAAPLSGYLSDRTRIPRLGKRNPYIIVGCIVFAASFIIRPFLDCTDVILFSINVAITAISNGFHAILINCYAALYPETFPQESMGLATGFNGFTNLISAAIGIGVYGIIQDYVGSMILCFITAALIIVNMFVHVVCIHENPQMVMRKPKQVITDSIHDKHTFLGKLFFVILYPIRTFLSFLQPFKNLDFLWAFLTRFLFTLGVSCIQTFGLFFLEDKVAPNFQILWFTDLITTAEAALGVFMLFILVSGLLSSVVGGILSDRIGRKPVIMISSLLVCFGCVALAFITNYNLILLFTLFVGIGNGSYYGTDFSLVNDIIGQNEAAKALAMFSLAQSIPLVLASPIGGFILYIGQLINEGIPTFPIPKFGYNLMCIFGGILTFLSTILIALVKTSNIKKRKQLLEQQKKENEIKEKKEVELKETTVSPVAP